MKAPHLICFLLIGACDAETTTNPAAAHADVSMLDARVTPQDPDAQTDDTGEVDLDTTPAVDSADHADVAEAPDVGEAVDLDEPGDAGVTDAGSDDDAGGAADAGVDDTGTTADVTPGEDVKTPAEVAAEAWQTHCAACHGAEGQGTPLGYELRHPVAGYFEYVVRNGRPGVEFPNSAMPAWDEETISDETLAEMAAWLSAFPQPKTGEGLYKDYCANCHGQFAEGGPVFHDLLHEADHHDTIFAKVRNGVGGGNYADRLHYMPSWTPEQLSDAEITLIIEHLNTL